MGKGKERVLSENFCNCVSEEQNVEKENVGRGRKGFYMKIFVTVFQKGFTKGLGCKGFGFGVYDGIKCIRSGL